MSETKFKKGQSGNPQGRPKGSGLNVQLRQAIADSANDIVTMLLEQAKAGDIQAAKILLDRVCPSLKSESQPIDIPALAEGTLTERAQAIIDATANGQLAPDTATNMVNAIATYAKIIETSELEARIAALEAQQAKA